MANAKNSSNEPKKHGPDDSKKLDNDDLDQVAGGTSAQDEEVEAALREYHRQHDESRRESSRGEPEGPRFKPF